MSRSRPYHHGNLREALLAAGVALIAEAGPTGFKLREVARRADVSHNAPYRHFPDKNALLSALAAQGFDALALSLNKAARRGDTPLDRLRQAGLAYIVFALDRPEHFSVMFDAAAASTSDPAHSAGERAFQALTGLIGQCQSANLLPTGDSRKLAYVAWSLVHGIAKLALAGHFKPASKSGILDFARFAVDSSFRGLTTAG